MPTLEEWDPQHPAVWWEELGSQTISLRHPAYPAEAAWSDGDPATLQAIVVQYLAEVAEALGLPPLFGDDRKFDVPYVWLPLPDASRSGEPRASFWVTRYADPQDHESRIIDRSAVFLAVESTAPGDQEMVLGSRLGIRVIAHVSEGAGQNVRITGAARSIALPDGLAVRERVAPEFLSYIFSDEPRSLTADVRRAVGVSDLWIDGVRILRASAEGTLTEIYANVPQLDNDPDSRAYALTVRALFDSANQLQVQAVERFPLVAHAVPADLFPPDPASKAGPGRLVDARPNRSPERLAPFRETVTLEGIMLEPDGQTTLEDDLTLVTVMQSRLVSKTADETLPERINPATIAHPRVNPFAAASGYQRARATFDVRHTRSLFETIMAYGLSPFQYFQLALHPLHVRYRAGMIRGQGRDGKIVNAEVAFNPCRCHLIGPDGWDSGKLRPLQVRFALADLQRSTSRREPLGLAADPRWSWHEYCHVLLAARTGALELPFVHSAGDALAAITSDPWSNLAEDPWLRGYTFPWVYLHRRHDRSVYHGWSWCGRYHRQSRFDPGGSLCRRKGYQSEQILSSSLFRLYRALGGDTVLVDGAPDRPARERAADYTVYLILRTIQLLPPASWSVLETPDQLVSALIDADVGTWPAPAGPLEGRAGGWAHKVVRWAFEAQGLYATTNPAEVIDAPGKPPPVDVFIDDRRPDDRRPDAEGDHPRGGYVPVSLDWHPAANGPLWHASANAIQVDGAGQISVQVRSRGHLNADNVTVQVWWIDWPGSQAEPPEWDRTQWNDLGSSAPATVPAWPSEPVPFSGFAPFNQPSGTRRLILAAASCPADPANIDPATGLPCALVPTPIVDLVAGDNNLGLWLREVP